MMGNRLPVLDLSLLTGVFLCDGLPADDDPAMAGDPKAPAGGSGGLVQLLGDLGPMDTAAAERDRAVADKADDLDQLVDDLDEMDL